MVKRPSRRAAAPLRSERLTGPSWWDGLPDRTRHGISLLVLLVVAVAFYSPMLFTGKTVVASDAVQWRSMAASMIDHHEATGEEPLWSTNPFGGMPGYMITRFGEVPQIDTVATYLRKVIWPLSHFLFLLAGVYVLVVFLGGHALAGVLAAVGFGLTSYIPIILASGHNSKYIALCFAPWLLLAFIYALRRGTLLSALLFAAAMALNLRAGHPQITYYVLFTMGVWWIGEGVSAFRTKALPRYGKATALLALGTVLAALMVAYPYLEQAEYADYTIRGATSDVAGGADDAFRYAMAWSHAPGELLTLAIANAYGGGGGTYWGPKVFTGGPHYVGGIVLLLAIVALFRWPKRALAVSLGVAAGLMLLFSLGEFFEPLNRLMYDFFPLFKSWRVPETWLSVAALVLAVLAGLGATTLAHREDVPADAAQKNTRLLLGIVGVALGLALLAYAVGPSMLSFSKEGELQRAVEQIAQANNVSPDDPRVRDAAQNAIDGFRTERADLFRADALRTFLFLLLGAGLIALHRLRKIPAWAMLAGLALLVTVDLYGVGRRYLSSDTPTLARSPDPESQIAKYPFDDYLLQRVQQAGGAGHFRVLSLEGNPSQNARPAYFYESLNGYHGAKLRLFQDFYDHLLATPDGQISPNGLRLLATRFVVAGGTLPGYEVAFQDEQTGMLVLEDPAVPARAYFVGEVETLPDAPSVWRRVHEPTFDPRATALVTPDETVTTTPLDSASTATVTLDTFGPRRIAWNVETDAPRLLVASEVYYPAGWTAQRGWGRGTHPPRQPPGARRGGARRHAHRRDDVRARLARARQVVELAVHAARLRRRRGAARVGSAA